MTPNQKSLLRLHAEHFEAMASYVRECDPEELEALKEACWAASVSNCAWSVYKAAQFISGEIAALKERLAPNARERE